ncbi:MAG: hypothetical protein ACRD1U_04770 [Vicinamibacterales bacterium]
MIRCLRRRADTTAHHLLDTELIDFVEGTLSEDRMPHVERCGACRTQALALASTLRQASEDAVPDPPAVFWDQLSSRIHRAVAAEPLPRRAPWQALQPTSFRWAALAAAAALVLAVALWRSGGDRTPEGNPLRPVASRPAENDASMDEGFGDIELDEAWTIVRTVADDLPADVVAVEGGPLRAGSIEGLALRLSDEERAELARLLEEAIREQPAPRSAS